MGETRRLQTFPPLPSDKRRFDPKRPATLIAGLHRPFATKHDAPNFQQLANFANLCELTSCGTSAELLWESCCARRAAVRQAGAGANECLSGAAASRRQP